MVLPESLILFFILTSPFPGDSSFSGLNPLPLTWMENLNDLAPECFTTWINVGSRHSIVSCLQPE